MKVLFVYRNPLMGFSIGKVFKPIEDFLGNYAEVDSIVLPIANYSLKGLLINILHLRKQLKRVSYDVVLITGTENYLLPFIPFAKKVVVVHDLESFIKNSSGMRKALKKLMFIKVLRQADKIVSISEHTHQELLAYDFHSDIIYDPVSPKYIHIKKVINKVCPIILHIGTKPNKNLKNTIIALRGTKCHLRIVGKLSEDDLKMLQENNIDYSSCANISDEELLKEYNKCDIVNFPSLYEGFGMPIIEGQAIGRVVVTSNLSPMKDVAGGGAVLVDPNDIQSLRQGYFEAINHGECYIDKGLENVKRFSVETIARQYFYLLKSLL